MEDVTPADGMREEDDALARELGLLDGAAAQNLLRLRDGIVRLEKWVAFVGAGVSAGAGLPSWEKLTRALAARFEVECPQRPADNAFPEILQACLTKASDPQVFWDAVAEAVCGGEPTEVHDLLLRLPFQAWLTLNLDCLLVAPHERLDGVVDPRVISYPDSELQPVYVSGRRLIHLHGRCHPRERLSEDGTVLTRASYDTAYGLTQLPRVIEAAISAYAVLMVGTSLADWQIRLLLSQVRERERLLALDVPGRAARPHHGFALVETDGTEAGPAARHTWAGTALGVEPIFYINRDGKHTALLNTLRWLVRTTAPPDVNRYEVPE